jgi:aldose 1-epimerase
MRTRCFGFTGSVTALTFLISASSFADVEHSVFGTTSTGTTVDAYVLSNANGVTVRLVSLGALIDQINVPDREGNVENVVVALPDLAAYESSGSFNRTIGRYANRIAGGKITLDGVVYELPVNDNGIIIHGGPGAFGRKNWESEILSITDGEAVRFSLLSPDGDGGFPGNMHVTVTYTLDNNNALHIAYTATTDKTTVVNLTNHTYFNLAGNSSRDVYDHELQVLADEYTPADELSVPTGEYASVSGTPFDLREPARIRDRVNSDHPQMLNARGFDHNFVLNREARQQPALAIRLIDPETGRQMDTLTTEPGVQIFTANGFDGARVNATGTTLRQSYGIALETQHFPDSPNKPNFPSTELRPGEEFRSTTIYSFSITE